MENRYSNRVIALVGICAFLCASRPAVCEDCNNNGVPDDQDISAGTSEDCNTNGIPDECEAYIEHKLTASDAAAYDHFGCAVSISGDVAVIGASQDDDDGTLSGSAYVFRFNGSSWVEEAKLTASDAAARDHFGCAVSISGDVAVIGAYVDRNGGTLSGSAYIYRFNGSSWVEEAKLTASDAGNKDYFGSSVTISGDVAVVGAYRNSDAGACSGSAYVFRYDGTSWVEEAKLTASDAEALDRFGLSVSISGDVTVIGAPYDDDGGSGSGSAYVFRFDGSSWIEEAKLTASDAAEWDYFGWSVSISGDVAVIGAYLDDDNGAYAGAAYVYRRDGSTWVEEAKLTASDAADGDRFGCSVAISDDMAVIGSSQAGSGPGSAYVYRFDGTNWVEEAKLTASDAATSDWFGRSFSISGDVVVIGAYHDDDDGRDSGSAYVYVHNDHDYDGVIDDCDNCPDSDLSETIVINGCETGAANQALGDGCTMADEIAQAAAAARNHGAFVSQVAHLTNAWIRDGLISGADKGRIQRCAARRVSR